MHHRCGVLHSARVMWLRNARLADQRIVDVSIDDDLGIVTELRPAGEAPSEGTVHGPGEDLRGALLLPAPAEPHAHLDKALTADLAPNRRGDLRGAIDAWVGFAPTVTLPDMVARARAAALELVASGVTAIRSHANVYPGWYTAIEALVIVADELASLVELQIVALTTIEISGGEDAYRRLLRDALGIDPRVIVGGCPHLDVAPHRAIDVALDVAGEAGRAIDLHTDEQLDPSVLDLRYFAEQVGTLGFAHGATASHCVSLGMQSYDIQRLVSEEVASAGIAVIALPQTNLFLQGRDHPTATPRGLTSLRPLLDAGATLAAGADNVRDPFNLMGRSDPLETAALLVMAGHLSPDEAYCAVSAGARSAMGLRPFSVVERGCPADLVALTGTTVGDAMARGDQRRTVWKSGKVVARTTHERTFSLQADKT